MKLFKKITWISVAAAMSLGGGIAALSTNTVSANASSYEDIELSTAGGTQATVATVNVEGVDYSGIKLGTGKAKGSAVVSGISTEGIGLVFHAAAWKGTGGQELTAEATGCTLGTTSFTLAADDGVSNSSPFTLGGTNDSFKFSTTLSDVTDGASITFTYNANRFLIWGVQVEKPGDVDPEEMTGLNVSSNFATAKVGETTSVTATAVPETAIDVGYTWSSDTASVATVTSGSIKGVSAGNAVVTVNAWQTDFGTDFSKTVNVAVTNHSGSETDPFDADDAKYVSIATGSASTKNKYYVSGVVEDLSVSGGQATFNIKTADSTFKAYRTGDANGQSNVSAANIHNGDTALVYGSIVQYNDSTLGLIPEISYGQLKSVTSNVTLSSVEIRGNITKEFTVGEDFDVSELKVYAIYSDSSEVDVTSQATITVNPNVATAAGSITIDVDASFNDVDAETKQYTVTVKAVVAGEKKVSISVADYASANSWVNSTKYMSMEKDGFVVSHTKETGNTGKYYTSGTNWRFYQADEPDITVTAPSGKIIKTVKITYTVSNTGILVDADGNVVESNEEFTVNANSYVFGVANSGTATNGQVRITNVEAVIGDPLTAADAAAQIKELAGDSWTNNVSTNQCGSKYATAKALLLSLSSAELETFKTSTDTEIVSARAAYETWCDRNGDDNPYAGAIVTSSRGVAINTSSSIAIVMIAIASITLVGAAMMLKKRKFSK